MPSYRITEPHPTVLPNQRLHTGRGGAGNTYRVSPTSTLAQTTSNNTTSSTSSTASKFSSGRGGAGNIHPISDAAPFTFADLESEHTDHTQGVWHTGRGGAGNTAAPPKRSTTASRKLSTDSDTSSRSSGSFLSRLSDVFERR